MSTMSTHSSPARTRKPAIEPCHLYKRGHCHYGTRCKFSHDVAVQSNTSHEEFDSSCFTLAKPENAPKEGSSGIRPTTKNPCRAWKAGTCTWGSKCRFSHDLDVRRPVVRRDQTRDAISSRQSVTMSISDDPSHTQFVHSSCSIYSQNLDCVRIQQVRAAARERVLALAKEEAAKTVTELVLGSIVTYSAGLNVSSLITGFETSTLHVRNIPLGVKEDDVRSLFQTQGLDAERFHFVVKKSSDSKLEARIVTDNEAGSALALGLDGIEFQDEILVVEIAATNSLEGMSASTTQNSEVLTISWRAPSVRYVAEYIDIPAANEKVRELNRSICGGRRVKVEMNTQPPGRYIPSFRPNSIKISNLPDSITREQIIAFTGSSSVKCLRAGIMLSVEQTSQRICEDIERAFPGALKIFDDPPSTCGVDGVVSARAHFSSWDEARAAYNDLSNRRYGSQSVWLRLPDPMQFTIIIPSDQYKAQKAQWDSLLSSIKDRKACMLNIHETANTVRIRLSGSVKEAAGALKVRVENLAKGDKVEGWHRDFGISNNAFFRRVLAQTGAFLRSDLKRQTLKVYGAPGAVNDARELIKAELERLASMDHTVTLPKYTVGFFMREGIQKLKDLLGEDNVRFVTSSRCITVSGGEEARHALDQLIARAQKGNHVLPDASQGEQTCPICYDNVSSPHQLGCGHSYCVACFRHFISSALESAQLPLTCLGDETRCHLPIPIPTIQQFLPQASFNRLLEAAFDSYIAKHPEEFKFCKTPDCTQIYRSVRPGQAPRSLQCPSCFSAVCNGCHEDAHDGMTCAESAARTSLVEAERLNDAWIASQGGRVKKCPRCSVPIEKLEGCNHMTCRCGAHICWRCMGVFTADTIYPHMHSVHGGIHGDEPQAPPEPVNIGIAVDIEEQRELFRQLEQRRAVMNRQQNAIPQEPGIYVQDDHEHLAQLAEYERQRDMRWREHRERENADRERRAREFQEWRQREERRRQLEFQDRMRLQRQQEAERAARERKNSGWGCAIM